VSMTMAPVCRRKSWAKLRPLLEGEMPTSIVIAVVQANETQYVGGGISSQLPAIKTKRLINLLMWWLLEANKHSR